MGISEDTASGENASIGVLFYFIFGFLGFLLAEDNK